MQPEQWRKVWRLYHSVLEQEKDRRIEFLLQACRGDEELRREVASLLAQTERTGSFLEHPALELAGRALAQDEGQSLPGSRTANAEDPMVGRAISHYQVLENLRAGGMGVVYKAQDLKLTRFVA